MSLENSPRISLFAFLPGYLTERASRTSYLVRSRLTSSDRNLIRRRLSHQGARCRCSGIFRGRPRGGTTIRPRHESRLPLQRPIAAKLAGSGRGENGVKLSEADRAHGRRHAWERLHAALAAWAKNLDSGNVRLGGPTPTWSGHATGTPWNQMPPGESQECRKLLRDLDALLDRATGLM